MPDNDPYPEHTRLHAIKDDSQKIGAFLDWLEAQEEAIRLCRWNDQRAEYERIYEGVETILSRYFEIDLNKIETERRAMLEEQRRLNIYEGVEQRRLNKR